MVKKFFPKKGGMKKPVRKGGRRLGGPGSGRKPKIGGAIGTAARVAATAYNAYQRVRQARRVANRAASLAAADNITTIKAFVSGVPKKPDFAERVARIEQPPIVFKRNYQFNAEGVSGRKTWFSFEINQHNANDLHNDIQTYKDQYFTDTSMNDPAVLSYATATAPYDNARFYVDYLSEKLRFMNSSTNALFGKIHVFAHKKDNDNQFHNTSVPITPINLMMLFATNRLPARVTSGYEQTVGNGWKFDTSTSGLNVNSVYNMPGSSINVLGVCAQTDPAMTPALPYIADSMNYFFRKVETIDFSLKPGQQINRSYIWHDLKDIQREQQDYVHLAGISYSIVVEFQGQVVGSNTVVAGDGVVTTGTTQLSVIRESKRIIGVKNRLKSKTVMLTAPLTILSTGEQVIINPDSGTQFVGAQTDF